MTENIAKIIYYGVPPMVVALIYMTICDILFVSQRDAFYKVIIGSLIVSTISIFITGTITPGNISFLLLVFSLTLLLKLVKDYLKRRK